MKKEENKMKVRNIFYHLVNIVFFLILFNIIHFVFVTITDLDIALNLEWLQYRIAFESYITNGMWSYILSFFYACVFDYFYLKNFLRPLKLEKYSNEIFTLLGCIPAILTIGLFIFYKLG